MDRLAVSTVVYRSPADVYDFLREFSRFPRYSRYLKAVDPCGACPDEDARGEGEDSRGGVDGDDEADAEELQPPAPSPAPTPQQASVETDAAARPPASGSVEPGPPTRATTAADDAADTEYDLRLAWWKLGCSVRSRVTDAVRPERIDWKIVDGVEARGRWLLSPAPDAAERECVPDATRVRLEAEFDPESVDVDRAITLPDFFDLDRAVTQVKPLLVREVERVVVRAVRDLEGEARDVTISVDSRPDVAVPERG